jgi:hypothetical protein
LNSFQIIIELKLGQKFTFRAGDKLNLGFATTLPLKKLIEDQSLDIFNKEDNSITVGIDVKDLQLLVN